MPLTKENMRKMVAYRSMSDAEFEEAYSQYIGGIHRDGKWEERIQQEIDRYDKDYDLTGLKSNDMNNLRTLAVDNIRLRDLENQYNSLTRDDGITQGNIQLLKNIYDIRASLTKDILSLEENLKISRKVRKSEDDLSAPEFLEKLKEKARKFSNAKMVYILCPACKKLLATVWLSSWEHGDNAIRLSCTHKKADGIVCGEKFTIKLNEVKKQGSNLPEFLPESMR